jgi:hypothetical protein
MHYVPVVSISEFQDSCETLGYQVLHTGGNTIRVCRTKGGGKWQAIFPTYSGKVVVDLTHVMKGSGKVKVGREVYGEEFAALLGNWPTAQEHFMGEAWELADDVNDVMGLDN